MCDKIPLKYRFASKFLPSSSKKGLIVLTGARQTGKTTLVKKEYSDLRYINLDAPENRESIKKTPTPSWAASVGNAILDEAQKEPVVFEKVKYAFDDGGISFTLLLGSSQILLLKKIRESLAGRAAIHELWPLLMSELGSAGAPAAPPLIDRLFTGGDLKKKFSSIPPVLLAPEDAPLRDAEQYLLQWGGMPALLPLSETERWKWLKDYEYTYLERDLSDLARLDDLEPFRTFQRLAALQTGSLLNYSELARDASVSVDTARRYLEYLRISYQVILLQPYRRNLTSAAVKTPKLYWLDTGLARQLSGMRGLHAGNLYETMVVAEIYKWIKTAQHDAELFFYRTRAGLELDMLIKASNGVTGVEIKSRRKIVQSDLRAMKNVAQALGDQWRGGLVVYQGDEIRQLAEPDIWAVPSRRLLG